jgi:hypothetical protein
MLDLDDVETIRDPKIIMRMNSLSTFLVLVSNIFTISWANNIGHGPACTYPQPCWPSQSEWKSLNSTLHGSLVRARPPAYVCHEPDYNEAQCQGLQQNWTSDFWRSEQPGAYHDLGEYNLCFFRSPSLILSTVWENGDSYCNIDNNATVPCNQGLVPIYVAQVKSVAHVQTAVKFAKKHRISTRVKGASHDL